ncbi:MAG: glycosyltransferase family 2 protein [Roseiflexus sp.]|nr:glycosyltransferase family 2 protein [Roseiflexus sp.]
MDNNGVKHSLRVEIIVLHWRDDQRTRQCLTALQALDYPSYSVTLIDNGSHNGSLERLIAQFPDIPVIRHCENKGFAGGVNPAIRRILEDEHVDAILLLNNDALPLPDSLWRMVQALEQYPHIGILSAAVVRADRPNNMAGAGARVGRYWTTPVAWNEPLAPLPPDVPISIQTAFGCAVLIRRGVFERIGLFDERYFFYYEDTDFCLRARSAGFEIAYLPGAIVHHAVSASTRGVPGLREFYLARSRQIFFRKRRKGVERLIYSFIAIVHLARVARWKLQQASLSDAIGYIAGGLVGLIMPVENRREPHRAREERQLWKV